MQNDELKIYRGKDFVVSKYIKIHQPSLSEICDYGEQEYYSMIYHLTATPQTMKVQLWDIGVDYTKIAPYELFYNLLYKMYSQDKTSIIFGDLDFTRFQVMQRKDDNTIVLCQTINDESVIIDEFTYNMIMDYLRQVHCIYKDEKMPANETTKMILIEDDKPPSKPRVPASPPSTPSHASPRPQYRSVSRHRFRHTHGRRNPYPLTGT